MELILFDIDGTLIPGSTEWGFVRFLYREGAIAAPQVIAWLRQLPPLLARHGGDVIRKNKGYLSGAAVSDIEALAARYVREHLEPRIRPVLRDRLLKHRADGSRIAVLSGTLHCIARPLADALQADLAQGAELVEQDGRFDGQPPRLHPIRDTKVLVAMDWLARLDLKFEAVTAYGDSGSDLPLLRRVGHPVAVAPKKALRKAALAAGWPILCDPAAPGGR